MEQIDKFIYINLKKRTDRNKHILNELKKFQVPDEKIIRFEAIEHIRGHIGCSMSHLKVAEMFRDSGDKAWCIIEDDHYFTKSYEKTDGYIKEFLENENYDVLVGLTCALKASPIPGNRFFRVLQTSMTSFYIAKKNIAEALIASHKQSIRSFGKNFDKRGINVDHMWYHLMKVFVFVSPYFDPISAQLDDYSDIRKKKMNYSNYIKQKIDRELDEELISSDNKEEIEKENS